MSLIEVLVVVSLLSVVALGMSSVMYNTRRAQKGIDLKSEAQSIGSALRLMVLSPSSCRNTFGVTTTTGPSEWTPRWISAQLPQPGASAAPESRELDQIKLVDQDLVVGGNIGESLVVESLLLTPRTAPVSGEYLGDLKVVLKKRPGVQSIGLGVFSETVPLSFKVDADPTGAGKLSLSDCHGSSELDPRSTCDAMGGRWLEATIAGRSMPKPRCNFGSDISLGNQEAPDPVNVLGDSTDGQRVEECYYSVPGSSVVRTYLCPARSPQRSGERCMFAYGANNTWAKQWQVRGFEASGSGGTWSPTARINCTKGVKVTLKSPTTDVLDHHEPLWLSFGNPEPAGDLEKFLYEQDRISSVTRCRTSPDQELWVNCGNPNAVASAKDGQGGSCIFVRNIELSLSSGAQQAAFNDYNSQCTGSCQDLDVDNYTGWIFVNSTRPRQSIVQNIQAGASLPTIREARGSPCYQVEINKAQVSTEMETRILGPDLSLFQNANTRVLECVHEGYAVENASSGISSLKVVGAPQKRFTTFVCDWSNGPPSSFSASITVGSFGTALQTLPFAGFLGFVGDSNPPSGSVPMPPISPPGLQQGGCWYVGGPGERGINLSTGGDFTKIDNGVLAPGTRAAWKVRLQNYAVGVAGNNTEATCVAGSGVCRTDRFSEKEWVYFRGGAMPLAAPLPDNSDLVLGTVKAYSTFYLNAYGDPQSDYSIRTRFRDTGGNGTVSSLPELPAVPCNRGIRVPLPSSH